MIERIQNFFRTIKAEFFKVSWPTKVQTIYSTSIVFIVVALISIYLGILNLGFSFIIQLIL